MQTLKTTSSVEGFDLVTCEQEPIRLPGSIQPHGILFVLRSNDLVIRQISSNAETVINGSSQSAIGRALTAVVDSDASSLIDDLRLRVPARGNAILRLVIIRGTPYNAIAHRSDDMVLLELEHAIADAPGSLDALYPQIREVVEQLRTVATVADINAIAVAQVRSLTGFDRVMIYRFDEQWNGTVVAENRNDLLPSYLDLRFPASDIPAQARDLYLLNRLRIIPDAAYQPVSIIPRDNPDTGRPTDLSFSVLRSVSPVHLEYMRNMQTPASMSISLVDEGRLWGLISCHSATPRQVPVHVRMACDFLGQIVAMQIASKERATDAVQRVERQAIQTRLLAFMAAEEQFIHGLTKYPDELLSLTNATGAAVVLDGECVTVGIAPTEAQVSDIIRWLRQTQNHDEVFATSSLANAMRNAEPFSDVASGLLAISISQLHPSYVLWFRPEVIQTVNWGGDPRKPVDLRPGETRLHPRKSFEMWKETVRLESLPWSPVETDVAGSLRNAIIGIVMRKAEELAQLTEDLKRSNKELEAFSYSVSHDLRAPFRHIVGYAELLKESDLLQKDALGQRYVGTIIESALSAGKLVDDLLGFSQMGRSALTPIRLDMNRLVDEVRRLLRPDTTGRQIHWQVGELAPAWGDPGMMRQVLQNLIANAIKYTRKRDIAVIEIQSESTPQGNVYSIRDNGVGFEMAYVDKLFGVFQRLHRMEDFEGTGIGLANVRRIIERHGGSTWADGAVDRGATFYFSIPRQAEG